MTDGQEEHGRSRTQRIIAVFGGSKPSDKVLARAKVFGRAVVDAKQILLTGGRPPSPTLPASETPTERKVLGVKDGAIEGAGTRTGIGVARTKKQGATALEQSPEHFTFSSDLDQKRNYLEAFMCDAAIVLKGDEGTRSEAASALSLGRPVAFIGPYWKTEFEKRADEAAWLEWLIEGARTTFEGSRGPNEGLGSADDLVETIRSGLSGELHYEFFPDATPAADVVQWIVQTLPKPEDLLGEFPDGVHDDVAGPYRTWLARLPS